MTQGGSSNGDGVSIPGDVQDLDVIADLAQSCRQFVWAKLQIELDDTVETLPILDHYIALARADVLQQPQTAVLLTQSVGAYFGTVLAATIDGFWRVPSQDDHTWLVCCRSLFLAVNPVGVAHDVLYTTAEHQGPSSELRLDRVDREVVDARLSRLPRLREEEYFTLSTRVETIEIALMALRDHRHASGGREMSFESEDYSTV